MTAFTSKIFDRLPIRSKPKEIDGNSELLLSPPFFDIFETHSGAPNPLMPTQQRSVESISTSTQYRQWLLEQAERWRAFEGEPKNHIKGRHQFFAYAKQCIANSGMNARERTLSLTVLQETERDIGRR